MSTARDVIRKKAREAHARQQLLIAEQHYRTLLKEDPVIDDVINLGALLRSQGRLQEGSLFYQKWVSKFSKDPRLILNACNCWNESNDARISISYLEEYICKQKVERKILICYSDALNRLGRLKESNEVLHKCIANNPEDKEIWIRIGLTHAKARQPKNALEAFNQANTIDPEDLEVTSNRITLLKDLGRLSEAESLINKLSAKNQQNVDIAQATAGLFLAQNKLTEATKIFQDICHKKPRNANYLLNWAATLRGLRWTVAPHRILKRAHCCDPSNQDVHEALMQILSEMAKNDAAERCMHLWSKDTKEIKDIYLFNRQFLGIGTSEYDSRYLAKQAQEWEKKSKLKSGGNLWQDTIQRNANNRKLRI